MVWGSSAQAMELAGSTDSDGSGSVYVFNCSGLDFNVIVNNGSAGTIPGWSSRSGPIGWTPAGLAVPLTGSSPAQGQFGLGDNYVELQGGLTLDGVIAVPNVQEDLFVLMMGLTSGSLLSIGGSLQGTMTMRQQ